jgi:hypothetical protein
MILSILIPSTYDRAEMLKTLLQELYKQINECMASDEVEVLTLIDDKKMPTGTKRNLLLQKCTGKYSVFIDSDDWVYEYYIKEILSAVQSDCDALGINGIITTNGGDLKQWFIAKDNPYRAAIINGKEVYLRYPNHITIIRTSISKQFMFPDVWSGEDYHWCTQIHQSGLIKTETIIEKPMYHYRYSTLNK